MHIIGMTMSLSSAYCWSIITVFHDHPSDKHVNLGSTVAAPEEPHPRLTRQRTDVAARASGRILPRVFFFFSWLAPTRLRLGPIRVESGQLGPYRAKQLKWPIQAKIQNSKKKKKKRCKTHRLNLITNPTSAHFIQTTTSALSHSVTRLSLSLCSLPLCLCSPSPLWLWDTQPLSHFVQTSALSHAFST